MAFVAGSLVTGAGAALSKIYLRSMDQWDAVPVPGTEGGFNPFFSPDGQWLGFLIGRPSESGSVQMKKVSLSGASPVVLTVKGERFGVTWGRNGKIVFAGLGSGLKSISETGGEPEQLTQLNAAANESSHRLPHFLPDGAGVLFTVLRHRIITPDWNEAQIWVYSMKTRERKLLIENGLDARYIGDGYMVFARQAKLFAVRFDLKTQAITGSPVPVMDGVTQALYAGNFNTQTGAAQFSSSENGALLYAPGSFEPPVQDLLVWVDRQGKATPLGTKPMYHIVARVSPDGKQVLFNEYYVGRMTFRGGRSLVRHLKERTTTRSGRRMANVSVSGLFVRGQWASFKKS